MCFMGKLAKGIFKMSPVGLVASSLFSKKKKDKAPAPMAPAVAQRGSYVDPRTGLSVTPDSIQPGTMTTAPSSIFAKYGGG